MISPLSVLWDQFSSTVHANSSIPNTDKFKHLKALLEGPAARVIQGLTLTSLNYDHARKLSEERYGRPQVIISAHMENLLKISPCTTDKPQQLRYMYDQICVQMRGLESLGITNESYGQLPIPIIMSKMPSDMRLQISRSTKKEVWDINELIELTRNEIEARETSEHIKVYTEKVKQVGNYSNQYGKQVNQATAATLHTRPQETMNKGTTSIRCVYCGNDLSLLRVKT